ncbi:MAG: 50S ribosomal protein L3 [Thermoleophilia bacterium]|jgi:large subunit ribosomal protein L3
MPAILGKKLGMTQIFTEEGDRIPVTVIEAGPCPVTQIKTDENDGYQALQIGFGEVKKNKVIKPQAGHFKKAGVDAKRHLAEVRCNLDDAAAWLTAAAAATSEKKTKAGKKAKAKEATAEAEAVETEVKEAEADDSAVADEEVVEAGEAETKEPEAQVDQQTSGGPKTGDLVTVEAFQIGQKVKVSGVSKGKGFAGVIKRHNFAGGPASHGAHFHRAPGSVGASAYPSRVFKGMKLPGQMGNKKSTQLGLTVVATDLEKNLLFLKGAVPGSKNKIVMIQTQ